MIKTTADTQLSRPGRKRWFWRMLLAICGACPIPASIRQDAASWVALGSYAGLAPGTIPESSFLWGVGRIEYPHRGSVVQRTETAMETAMEKAMEKVMGKVSLLVTATETIFAVL